MLEIEEVNQLSEKRKLHSIGVMKMCEKLAERYGEDPKRAMAVGLAHDMAKEMPEEEKMKYVKSYFLLCLSLLNNLYASFTSLNISSEALFPIFMSG